MTDQPVPPTAALLGIWLAFAWRFCVAMLAVFLACFLLGLLIGIIGITAGLDTGLTTTLSAVFGLTFIFAGTLWAGWQAFQTILGRSFGGWRLVVVPEKQS